MLLELPKFCIFWHEVFCSLAVNGIYCRFEIFPWFSLVDLEKPGIELWEWAVPCPQGCVWHGLRSLSFTLYLGKITAPMEVLVTLKSLSFSFRNCSEEKFSLHSNLPLESQKIPSVLIQNSQQKHQKVTVQAINGWGLWDWRVTSMLKQQAEKPGTKLKGKGAPGFQSFEGGCSPQQVSVLWIFCKSLTSGRNK